MRNYSFSKPAKNVHGARLRSWLIAVLLCRMFLMGDCSRAADLHTTPMDEWSAFVPAAALVGAASTYNPYSSDVPDEEKQTASGEMYDPDAWTAAVQIDLRDQFGGVRFGKNYRPAFALIECAGRRTVLKINDVGPLRPGRIIDLNQRAMRYCDPSLDVGVLSDVAVTPLEGSSWTPGPVHDAPRVVVAAQED